MPCLFLLLTILLAPNLVSSQWVYPPQLPSDRVLSDYTSGKATPIEYIVHDGIIGSFNTPIPEFSIMRCAQEGRIEPIKPSTENFTSTEGHIAPDGTWQVMDSYSDGGFTNIYSKGKNLWIIADFETLVGNATTGQICWWELYSVSSRRVQSAYDPITGVSRGVVPEVTLLGEETEYYFPSTPFKVNTQMRPGNRNYTWGTGGGKDNRASPTTINVSNKPTGAANALHDLAAEHVGGMYLLSSAIGMIFGFI